MSEVIEATDAPTADAEGTGEVPGNKPASKNVIIEVQNPTAEEMATICENLNVNYDFKVNTKLFTANFKKNVDKDTKIETIRKPVQLALPYPSVQGIVDILEGGEPGNNKGLDLLLEAMEAVVNSVARDILSDGAEGHALTAATFPVDKVTWEAIANMPKAQRRGGGIPKETWEDFAADYMEVMPTATGKTVEAVGNMVKILKDKLSRVRTNDEVLNFVVQQLAIYAEKSPNVEEYQECVAFLLEKADTFLNVSPEDLLKNLL